MSELSPSRKSRYVDLPAGMMPPDLTVDEVSAFRRESRWNVFKKVREGIYESYLDGRIRKIVFSSVLADRARAMGMVAGGKRRPGRPAKPLRKAGDPEDARPGPT
jgi:hypothetical protein